MSILTRWQGACANGAWLLLLGTAAGVASAWCAARYLDARASATEADLRSRYALRPIVVARAPLQRGQRLDATALAVRAMPAGFVPQDALAPQEAGRLLDRRLGLDVARGTPVLPSMLATATDPPRLAERLHAGERALTLAVDEVSSSAGQLQAGDRVDLRTFAGQGSDTRLLPLAQDIEILATGNLREPQDEGTDVRYTTVTLRLTSEQAARVLLAQQAGTIALELRAGADRDTAPARVWHLRDLAPSSLPQPRAADPAPRVELLVAGHGGLTPQRSWLTVGAPLAAQERAP